MASHDDILGVSAQFDFSDILNAFDRLHNEFGNLSNLSKETSAALEKAFNDVASATEKDLQQKCKTAIDTFSRAFEEAKNNTERNVSKIEDTIKRLQTRLSELTVQRSETVVGTKTYENITRQIESLNTQIHNQQNRLSAMKGELTSTNDSYSLFTAEVAKANSALDAFNSVRGIATGATTVNAAAHAAAGAAVASESVAHGKNSEAIEKEKESLQEEMKVTAAAGDVTEDYKERIERLVEKFHQLRDSGADALEVLKAQGNAAATIDAYGLNKDDYDLSLSKKKTAAEEAIKSENETKEAVKATTEAVKEKERVTQEASEKEKTAYDELQQKIEALKKSIAENESQLNMEIGGKTLPFRAPRFLIPDEEQGKYDEITAKIREQKQALAELEAQARQASEASTSGKREEVSEIDALIKSLELEKLSVSELKERQKECAAELEKYKQEDAKLRESKNADKKKEEFENLRQKIADCKKEQEALNKELEGRSGISKFFSNISDSLDKLGGKMKNIMSSMKGGFTAGSSGGSSLWSLVSSGKFMGWSVAIGAVVGGLKKMSDEVEKFNIAMKPLKQYVDDDVFGQLKESFKETAKMGSGQSMEDMAAAALKWVKYYKDLRDAPEALQMVVDASRNLATILGTTAEKAADSLTKIGGMFGLTAAEAKDAVNVIVNASKNSTVSYEEMMTAITSSGSRAKLNGSSFKELAAAISVTSSQYGNASTAASSYQRILQRLSTETNDKFNPKVVGAAKAFQNLHAAMEAGEDVHAKFGKLLWSQAKYFIENAEEIATFTDELEDNASAMEVVKSKEETAEFHLNEFKNAVSSFSDEVNIYFTPAITRMLDGLTNLIGKAASAARTIKSFFKDVGDFLGIGGGEGPKKPTVTWTEASLRKEYRRMLESEGSTIRASLNIRDILRNSDSSIMSISQDEINKIVAEENQRWKKGNKKLKDAKTNTKDDDKDSSKLDDDKANKKAQREAEKARKAAERKAKEQATANAKEIADRMKHEEEMMALEEKLRRANEDASVAGIQSQAERERAEREKEYKRTLEDIDREEQEIFKVIYERRKSSYENTHKGERYENTEAGAAGYLDPKAREEMIKNFSDAERKMYDDNKAYAVAKRKEQNAIFARLEADTLREQAQSMRDYLKEYGTFQEQKLAIAEEYAEKIKEAEKSGNKGEVLKLQAERDSQMATADAKALAMNIDWSQTFSGLGNVLEEIAKETLDKVNQYMETADFKGLSAEAKQAYQELKKQLIDAGGQKASNPFAKGTWTEIGALTNKYREQVKTLSVVSERHAKDYQKYNKALDNEVKAQEKLAKAKEDQANHPGDEKYERAVEEANFELADASAKVKKAFDEVRESGEEMNNQQQNVTDTQQQIQQKSDAAAQGLNNFNTVVSQLTSGTLTGFADGVSNIIASITSNTEDDMKGLSGLFGEAGKQIGGIVGAILSIIDMLGTDPAKFITDILDKIADVIEAIISNIPQIIGAIIQGIGNIIAGVFKGLGSLFGLDVGGKDNHEEMVKRQQEYTRSIESSSRALNKFTSELERSYGIMAMENAKNGEEIIRKNMESIVNGIDSVLSDNYGGGHSDYYHVNKQQDVLQGILRYGQANGIKAGSVGSWQDLLTMNTSEALAKTFKVISESGDDLWRRITTMGYNEGALEEWINKLIDTYDQIEENNKKLMEQLTTTTADNVYDDYLDSLYDLADGSEEVTKNIAEDWQKMVNRMVVNNLIGGKMREELEAWYKELYDLQTARSEGRITNYSYEVSLNELQKKYNDIIEKGKTQVQQFTEDGIIKPISEATDEVKKYFEDLRDSWASTLSDMTATTEDWKNELIDQVLSDLVESTILDAPLTVMVDGAEKQFDDFKKYLEDWTNRYKAIIEDQTLTDEERTARLKAMIKEQTDVRDVQAERSKALAEGLGKDMREAFSNSLDNLGDTLLEALLDTEKDAESMGKEIASSLIKEMLQTMLSADKYADKIAKIKEAWQMVLTGKNTDESGNVLFTMEDVLQDVSELNNEIANDKAITTLADQYKELNKQLENSDNLFNGIKETFANAMMDINKTADEMASDIGQTIAKNIIDEMVVTSAVKPLIDNLQKAFDAANVEGATYSSVIGDEAVQTALNELKKAFPELQETAKGIMVGLGVKMNETAKDGFSDLKGMFISTLTDMDADAETLGKNLGKSMMEQMLNAMVENRYKNQIKEINDRWADALEAGDPAKIEAIKQEAEALFATIENDQSIKKLADEIKSLTDNGATSPFDNLRSSFFSALTDMNKSARDFTKEISTMIAESFVDSFVMGDMFDEKLADWKRRYKEITSNSGLSEEERMRQLRGLSTLISQERTNMQGEVNEIYKMLGIKDGQDQSATMNMAEAATYDQFELYLGMETSHLMIAEETKGLVAQVLSTLQGLSGITNASQSYGEQIFMRLGTTNEYLLSMKKAVEGIHSEFGLKIDRMNAQLAKWG